MEVLDYLVEIKEISKLEKKALQFLIIGTDKILNPFNKISIEDISKELGTEELVTSDLVISLSNKKLVLIESPFSSGESFKYIRPNLKEIEERDLILS